MRVPALCLLLIALAVPVHAQQSSAELYLEACAGCHTIGGGELAGPDLIASTKWPPGELRVAVLRMKDNVDGLTDAQADGLVELLKDPNLQQRLAAVEEAKKAATTQRGSPDNGARLFFGDARLQHGGSPCFACHAVNGRGGTLAADLTASHARMGENALLSATERPGFPLMKAAYAAHPVTSQEALDVVAYLQQAAAADPRPDRTGLVHGVAAGAAALVFTGLAFTIRPRRRRNRS